MVGGRVGGWGCASVALCQQMTLLTKEIPMQNYELLNILMQRPANAEIKICLSGTLEAPIESVDVGTDYILLVGGDAEVVINEGNDNEWLSEIRDRLEASDE